MVPDDQRFSRLKIAVQACEGVDAREPDAGRTCIVPRRREHVRSGASCLGLADVRQLYRTQNAVLLEAWRLRAASCTARLHDSTGRPVLSPTISEVAIGLMTLFLNVPSQTLLHLSHRDLVVTFRSGG
jgi:hypothetical protein